ncbi:MAG: hypothetical protein JWM85_348 [Acidimicrobiaceae bacterium]|nr:hypothetical protein [Acidimicrobiaceae bacterium]
MDEEVAVDAGNDPPALFREIPAHFAVCTRWFRRQRIPVEGAVFPASMFAVSRNLDKSTAE